jgi:hypothetical protein
VYKFCTLLKRFMSCNNPPTSKVATFLLREVDVFSTLEE